MAFEFPALPSSWQAWLQTETTQPYFKQLQHFLAAELAAGKQIFPAVEHWFAALSRVDPQAVRVVILGQDPYHGPGQAHGLSFSVPPGVRPPPSLMNIFKEIERDLAIAMPSHGCLDAWAGQGVLLLNSVLTVEADSAGSHRKRGWERFTDALISKLAQERQGIVFMLWGAYAEAKAGLIDADRHLILRSAHPSPLSAYRGFLGNQHFSKANQYLSSRHSQTINWQL